jgi:hypothetical protein
MKPHYTDEEANAILRRAVERMPMKDEMSHEQLEKIASEIGITPEALRQAEVDYKAEDGQREQYRLFLAHERGMFKSHLYSYIGVITSLFILNFVTSREYWWFLWPAFAWGLGLFFHSVRVYARDNSMHIEAYNTWLRQRQPKVLPPTNDRLPRI